VASNSLSSGLDRREFFLSGTLPPIIYPIGVESQESMSHIAHACDGSSRMASGCGRDDSRATALQRRCHRKLTE
jgi:hypothetical protein